MFAISTTWWYQWCDFVNVSVDAISKFHQGIGISMSTPNINPKGDIEGDLIHESEDDGKLSKFKTDDLMLRNSFYNSLNNHRTSDNSSRNLDPIKVWEGDKLAVLEEDEFYDRPG